MEPAAHALARVWRANRMLGMACSLVVCAGLSMFVNDTPVLVLALPILLSLGVRAGVAGVEHSCQSIAPSSLVE